MDGDGYYWPTDNTKISLMCLICVIIAVILCNVGCAGRTEGENGTEISTEESPEEPKNTTIEVWAFAVGSVQNSNALKKLAEEFMVANSDIVVRIKEIDYSTGDAEVEAVLGTESSPDIVFEGPERLVAGWGRRGLMIDLTNIVRDSFISDSIDSACRDEKGDYFIYPVCMTAHCMVLNRKMFEEAGAWQYIDEDSRTWTTEGFENAVHALSESGIEVVANIYCMDQSGDQGTRALVTNLYSGEFTSMDHKEYIFNSEENIRALELLRSLNGIRFNSKYGSGDDVKDFCAGKTAMTFCWNSGLEITNLIALENTSLDIFPIAFPNDKGEPKLQYGVWGLGVFDTGDSKRIDASKKFIDFIVNNNDNYEKLVQATGFWATKEISDIYANDDIMTEYEIFNKYIGDYYQISYNWTEARKAWFTMLQNIGNGGDIAEEIKRAENKANEL